MTRECIKTSKGHVHTCIPTLPCSCCYLDLNAQTTYHRLDHVWPLCAEVLDGVEDIYQSLCLHPLYGCAQSTECTCTTNASTVCCVCVWVCGRVGVGVNVCEWVEGDVKAILLTYVKVEASYNKEAVKAHNRVAKLCQIP